MDILPARHTGCPGAGRRGGRRSTSPEGSKAATRWDDRRSGSTKCCPPWGTGKLQLFRVASEFMCVE